MEKIEALKKIRNASILSLVGISGGLLALIISSSLDAQEGMLGYYNDPLILIDLALFCFLTWGLFYRNSIICAVILLLYTTVSRIFFYIEFEEVSYQLIWIPLFAYFYIQAIRGALIIRQIEGVENKKLSIWSRILLGVLALVFIPLVTLGALIEIGVFLPGAEIREGKDLTWEEITLLRDNLLIEEKEEIVYFFSAGWRSILEDGSIITDKRVISYYQEIEGDSKGEVFNWYLYYDEIRDIKVENEGNFLDYFQIKLTQKNSDYWFSLLLPIDDSYLLTEARQYIDRKMIESARNKRFSAEGLKELKKSRLPIVPSENCRGNC